MTAAEPEQQQGDPEMEKLLLGVLACVCHALADAGRAVCCCKWYRGRARPPMDGCDCTCDDNGVEGQGVAWIRWVSTGPDARTRRTELERRGFGGSSCFEGIGDDGIRVTFEVGVYRCAPAGDPDTGPECSEDTQIAADLGWDDRLIRTAVMCCEAVRGRRLMLVLQEPDGPAGGCVGSVGTWTVDL